MTRYLYTSVTRISDLRDRPFDVDLLDRELWATGDYVVGEALDTSGTLHNIELPNGRMMEVVEGDLVVGALGARAATLEAVGDWQSIQGNHFEALTPAGLFGRLTSRSPFLSALMPLAYRGHVRRADRKLSMPDAVGPPPATSLHAPIMLITGTSQMLQLVWAFQPFSRYLKTQTMRKRTNCFNDSSIIHVYCNIAYK